MPSFPVEDLSLASIRTDGHVQARLTLDSEAVDRYADDMTNGDAFPPGVVFRDDAGEAWMAAGFHRLAAHCKIGRAAMACQVRPGTLRDAQAFAIGDNADHGLPRTNGDKRQAVEMILADEEWGKLSTEQVAKMARVSWFLANTVRNEWEIHHGRLEKRVGVDGVQREAPAEPYERNIAKSSDSLPLAREASDDATTAEPPEPEPSLARETAPVGSEDPPTGVGSPTLHIPKVVTDAFDVPVPKHLLDVWLTALEMRQVKAALLKAKREAASLVGEKGAEKFTAPSNNTFANFLDNAIETLAKAIPYVVCPECDGDRCDNPKNSPCEGRGWVHHAQYASLSVSMKRKAERYRTKKSA